MVKVMTDSTSCLTKREADELGVTVVPITYIVDGALFSEGYADENGSFEELLRSDKDLTTSQPSPVTFENAFQKELALGNEVVCLTLSSRLSGTYSSACIAAQQVGSEGIFVCDSLLSAGGLYLLVLEAVELAAKGLPASEIVNKLEAMRDKIGITFTLEDMTRLRKSGRIGFVRMNVGTYLNIMPILQCKDGMIVADGVVRGKNNAIKKLTGIVPQSAKGIVVNYIIQSASTAELCNALSKKYPHIEIKLHRMGPVLGIHLGPTVFAVSYIF